MFIAGFIVASCGGDSSTSPTTPENPGSGGGAGNTGAVARVEMTEVSVTIAAGASAQLQAKAYTASNHTIDNQVFSWSSDNNAVATVNGSGLVTAHAQGTARITASAGGKSAVATVTVGNPAPIITSIDPLTVPINTAATIRIVGTGFITTSQARFNGANRPTTYVSATELRMAISAADVPVAATHSVTVVNPAPGGGPSNAVVFNAAGAPPTSFVCPARAITFPSVLSENLQSTDCRLTDNTYFDFYQFTLTQQSQVTFSMSGAPAIDPFLFLVSQADYIIAAHDDNSATDRNSTLRAILPAGTWRVAANTAVANQFGPYVLNATSSSTASASDCARVWVYKGVTISEVININDCVSGTNYSDRFYITLNAGQTVTLTMTSATIDPHLFFYNASGNLITSDNNGGGGTAARITYTATSDAAFIIGAGTASAGVTGGYTLTIQ